MVSKHIKSDKNYKKLNIVSKSNCADDNNVIEGRIWFWTVYSDCVGEQNLEAIQR